MSEQDRRETKQCVTVCVVAHPHSDAGSGDESDDRRSDSLRSRRSGPSGRHGAAPGVRGRECTGSDVYFATACSTADCEGCLQGTEELEVRIMVQARPGQDIR